VRRRRPILVDDLRFAQRHTNRPIKMAVPGPMTVVDTSFDEAYGDEAALAMDVAGALNAELLDLQAAGCAVLQIDEPAMTRIHRGQFRQGLIEQQQVDVPLFRYRDRFVELHTGPASRPLACLPVARVVDQDGAKKTAHFVKIPMVSNLAMKQADKYRTLVHQFAEQYRISPSLVFAVIRTESNFNPYAVSSAPAYGLMQLVPTSGGREAYRKAKGKDVTPSRDYLFDPANNVELGTAFLNVLMFNQLENVEHSVSREYCVIAAYNTGAGNVFRTFSRDRTNAINQINGLQPAGVYDQLRQKLPYEETRHYLEKVTGYRRAFVSSSESSNQ